MDRVIEKVVENVYIQFGEEIGNIDIILPYILGEYYINMGNVGGWSEKIQLIRRVLVTLSKDELKTEIFCQTKLENRIFILEEMATKLSQATKKMKF